MKHNDLVPCNNTGLRLEVILVPVDGASMSFPQEFGAESGK